MKASILWLLADLRAVLQRAGLGGWHAVLAQEPRASLLDQPSPPERHLRFLPRAGSLCEEAQPKARRAAPCSGAELGLQLFASLHAARETACVPGPRCLSDP